MQQDYIDKNLSAEKTIHKDGLMFYNVKEQPFDLYGFYSANKNELFKRLPDNIARQTSQGVATLYTNTSGGRVRFGTDSKKIAIIAKFPDVCYKPHMPLTCVMGFDLYSYDNNTYSYVKTFIPPFDTISGFEAYYEFPDAKMRDLTLNFPLYNNVSELYIGIDDKCSIYPGKHYSNTKPVVYYGSSITQGACASRPGNCYTNILMREFDIDFINLGFAGSAKGEECISKYIADMEMSCFVLDYDYNTPSPEHLQNTHEAMFLKVREKHPHLPIVIMSSPDTIFADENQKRRDIIKQTYVNAIKRHDNNVYLIDGSTMFGAFGNDYTVDGIHPNDFGFRKMADSVAEIFKIIFNKDW